MENEEKKMFKDYQDALEYAQDIIDTVRNSLVVLDGDLKIVSASKSFYKTFKVDVQNTEKQLIYSLGNGQWNIPKLKELLETIIPYNASFDDFQVEHDFQNIGRRIMMLNARRIPRPPEKPRIILLAIEDITGSKMVEVLHDKIRQLEIFTKAATGRELRILDLKKKVQELEAEVKKVREHLS